MEKSVVKKILINVMLLLFVAVNGSAQFITGSITDRQGLPVEFANIVLLSVPDSSFLQGTVSDESGSFRIQTGDSISIRTYVIKISSIGYQTIYRDTRAGNMENIVLSDEAILLDEAVVIGKRPDFQIKDGIKEHFSILVCLPPKQPAKQIRDSERRIEVYSRHTRQRGGVSGVR